MPGKVLLRPQDHPENAIEVSRETAEMSKLIKEMLAEDDDETSEIPLPNVKRSILSKVIEFCEHHSREPMAPIETPIKSVQMKDIVSEWDANFIDLDQIILFDVILAANYLDISDLLSLGCAKIASMIKDRTPEDIKDLFNIDKNSTPEEEEQIKQDNLWIYEV